MSAALAEVLQPGASLQELEARANREHDLGCAAAARALTHWIASGESLLAAREQMEAMGRGWGEWVDEHFCGSRATAQAFIRLATYQDLLAARSDEITTVQQALRYLRGLPETAPRGPRGGYTAIDQTGDLAAEARRMLAAGAKQGDVAALFGVSETTVWRWTDPVRAKQARARQARARRAREKQTTELAKRAERDRAMRSIGGSVAECYSMLRKTAQALDRAEKDADSREIRAAVRAALAKVYGAEDEIVRAVGVS